MSIDNSIILPNMVAFTKFTVKLTFLIVNTIQQVIDKNLNKAKSLSDQINYFVIQDDDL